MFRSLGIACALALVAVGANAATLSHNCTVTPDLNTTIAAANPGDTINVTGGTCSSAIVIQKTLTVRCTGTCTLPSTTGGLFAVLVNNNPSNVTVEGFTFNAPVTFQNGTGHVIRRNVVQASATTAASCGIEISNITNAVVTGNTVSAANNGICIFGTSSNGFAGSNILMANTVSGVNVAAGIVVKLSDNNHITGNTLTNVNGTAITVVGSKNNVFDRNTLSNFPLNPAGSDGILLNIGDDAPEPNGRLSSNNIICKNKITSIGFVGGTNQRPAGTGVFLNKKSDGTCVVGNRVSNNTEGGITSFGSSYGYWYGNDVFQNGQVGVFLWDNFDFPAPASPAYPGARTQRNYIHNNLIRDIPINGLVQGRGTKNTEVAYNYLSSTAFNTALTVIQGVRWEFSPQRSTGTESPKIFGNTMKDLFGPAYFDGTTTGARFFRNRALNAPKTLASQPSSITWDAQAFIGGNYWENAPGIANPNPAGLPYTGIITGYSDRFPFKDPHFGEAYTINATNPRLGAALAGGTTKTIQWQSRSCLGVDIELLAGGVPQSTLAANYPNHGHYIWDVSAALAPASNYQIRLTCKGPANSATGVSSTTPNFRIANGNLALLSPGCGEPLTGGSNVRVAWTKQPSITSVNVEYWRDDAFVSTLATGATGDFVDVTIPAVASSRVTLKLTSNDANAQDSSDDQIAVRTATNGTFTNVPASSVYVPGQVYDIEWTQPNGTFYQDLEMFDGTLGTYVMVAADLPSCTRRYRMFTEDLWMLQGHFRLTFKDASHNAITSAVTSNAMSVRYQTTTGAATNLYRLFRPSTGEHLLSTSITEYNFLQTVGWNGEGRVGGLMDGPATMSGIESIPFYRMYRADNAFHFWSTARTEYFVLRDGGVFQPENFIGYMFPESSPGVCIPGTKAMRRLSLKGDGRHHYSEALAEYNTLVASGAWNGEGVIGCILN